MHVEVEIKAWVRDLEGLREKIVSLGGQFERDYLKEDRYFRFPGGEDVRIRIDDGHAYFTFKDKSLENGLETNKEFESGVEKPEVLAELLRRSGARDLVNKVKIGRAWRLDDLLLELSEIRGLGHFLEIECIVDSDEPGPSRTAGERVRAMLSRLGIPDSDVESRPYTQMLLASR